MAWLTNLVLTLASLAYPLIWLLFGADSPILAYLPYLLAVLWAVKARLQAVGFQQIFAIVMALILLIVGFTRTLETMYWYPVIINGLMLALFGGSLFKGQPVVERLARLQDPNLPPQAVRYTRNVTKLWCGVFLLNILVCVSLIWLEQFELWAIYSGVVSYVMMGVVIGGEWGVRKLFILRQ